MKLNCINDIITKNLAINIDISNNNSWNHNTEFTCASLCKWNGAFSDNIDLLDFGLTAFDVSRIDKMWAGIKLTPSDTRFTMHRIGHNEVINPTPQEFHGVTVIPNYHDYPISANTLNDAYFDLSGGYLHGYFKLNDYNFELLPARYGKGITIETMLHINEESQGIFYMMGIRAEDKYNPHFDGEFGINEINLRQRLIDIQARGVTIDDVNNTIPISEQFDGVNTSENNYLDSFNSVEEHEKGFRMPEYSKKTVHKTVPTIDNIKNNVIAFEITNEKNIKYKYINSDGILIHNTSEATITQRGHTLISITYTPNNIISTERDLKCKPQRLGILTIYLNGRIFWKVKDFPEFYFRGLINDREKQIGVPYSISWGGGSFGLKHSWHYDKQTYIMYDGQILQYVEDNFRVLDENNNINSNLLLSTDDLIDNVGGTFTAMRVEFSGLTENQKLLIEFNNPITVLSNRDYIINSTILFNSTGESRISLVVYSYEVDLNIINESAIEPYSTNTELSTTFRLPDNHGAAIVYIAIKFETTFPPNDNEHMYIIDLNYTGADILSQDDRKRNLLIEQNFNSSYIGGIQKLRIYDTSLTSSKILHNAIIESNNNSIFQVNRGGRIIYNIT